MFVAVAIATSAGALVFACSGDTLHAVAFRHLRRRQPGADSLDPRVVRDPGEHEARQQQGVPSSFTGRTARGRRRARVVPEPGLWSASDRFIDDDVSKRDQVSGLPVLGIGRDLDQILCSTEAEGILIATDKISTGRIERATEVSRRAGVGLFRLDVTVQRLAGEKPQQNPARWPPRSAFPRRSRWSRRS